MKHLQTFEEFLNESLITEAKIPGKRDPWFKSYKVELSPGGAKRLSGEVNKNSLKSLKSFTFKTKDDTFHFLGLFGYPGTFLERLEDAVNKGGRPVDTGFQFNNQDGIPVAGNITFTDKEKGIKVESMSEGQKLRITVGMDSIKGFYFTNENDIFKTLEKSIEQITNFHGDKFSEVIAIKKEELGAAVIAIGTITIPSGKTHYDWSIYDSPKSVLYLMSGSYLCYASEGTFKVGDHVTLFSNDRKRELKSDTVIDLAPANREELVAMLFKHGYDYKPKKPFQKSQGKRKLMNSYSIKGTFWLFDR